MFRRIIVSIFTLLALLFVMVAGWTGYVYWQSLQPKENAYDPIIVNVARHAGLDPFLVRALVWRESRFVPSTHGTADEHGLMQVTPDVGQMWAKANKIENYKDDDLYDPETNLRAGTWYLDRAIKHWVQTDDPIPFALAEYNAGRKNANKWVDPLAPDNHTAFINRITYPGTRKYVETILAKREEFRSQFATNRWYKEDPNEAKAETVETKN